MTSNFVILAPLAALVLGAIGLGGGIYETLLVDRVWPRNPALVQPNRGGITRRLFWAPVQVLYEIALLTAAWMVWGIAEARWWILAALAAHFAARVWSFIYFIPNALRFERLGDLSEGQQLDAQRWVRLSRYRPLIETAALIALCVVIVQVAVRPTSG
jgi:hypothetical protein